MASGSAVCASICTSEPEKTRRSRSKAAPPTPAAKPEPHAGDFAAALMMIAVLPLTDAEKAEAVRRLLSSGSDGKS